MNNQSITIEFEVELITLDLDKLGEFDHDIGLQSKLNTKINPLLPLPHLI